MVFRTNEIIFRTNEIISYNEIIFRTNEIIFRTNEIIFRTNEIIFRTNEILFRTNEIKKSPHLMSLYGLRMLLIPMCGVLRIKRSTVYIGLLTLSTKMSVSEWCYRI